MKIIKTVCRFKTEYRNENNQLHNINGPAIEYSDGTKAYYINGKRHRLDGPAIEWADGTKEYWINGRYLTVKEYRLIKLNELLT